MTDEAATPSATRAVAEAFFGVGRGIASTVYGTIVTMATLTAAYATEKDPWKLATIVGSTALVLWLAHLYAHALSETIAHGSRPGRRSLYAIARIELGILFAAIAPVIALALGAAGVLRESAAIWLALSIGLVTLAVEGFRFARLERFGVWRTLVATGVNLALGLLVVLLKVTVEH